jgi:uncharacterized protein (DUF2249 family)
MSPELDSAGPELVIDVGQLPVPQQNALIHKAWEELDTECALVVTSSRDPVAYYRRLACEFYGQFRWEYLERGPKTWRVRLLKGMFPDPGFVPPPPDEITVAEWSASRQSLILDVRPIFARGDTPCVAIEAAAAQIGPGQSLVLLVPFEPVPLCQRLGRQGLSHKAEQQPDGSWRVEFFRVG